MLVTTIMRPNSATQIKHQQADTLAMAVTVADQQCRSKSGLPPRARPAVSAAGARQWPRPHVARDAQWLADDVNTDVTCTFRHMPSTLSSFWRQRLLGTCQIFGWSCWRTSWTKIQIWFFSIMCSSKLKKVDYVNYVVYFGFPVLFTLPLLISSVIRLSSSLTLSVDIVSWCFCYVCSVVRYLTYWWGDKMWARRVRINLCWQTKSVHSFGGPPTVKKLLAFITLITGSAVALLL